MKKKKNFIERQRERERESATKKGRYQLMAGHRQCQSAYFKWSQFVCQFDIISFKEVQVSILWATTSRYITHESVYIGKTTYYDLSQTISIVFAVSLASSICRYCTVNKICDCNCMCQLDIEHSDMKFVLGIKINGYSKENRKKTCTRWKLATRQNLLANLHR